MSWASAAVVYVIAWWLIFFMLLPVGVRTQGEARDAGEADAVVPGTPESAPERPRLFWKAAVATVLAGVVLAAFWLVQHYGLVSLRPADPLAVR
ncbi:MAG: hypothetical protein KatS3mg119_2213 [Rhodothalassiaceae bacterium]|nr:MAG: hypothetical protein KatS3mg119_2213 [Rhodothalassiaceae bacterium]